MPLLYETVFLPRSPRRFQEIIEKSYNLLDPSVASPPLPTSMTIPMFGTYGGKADTYVDVTWDPAKTVFTQALLRWSCHSWGTFLFVRAMEARFYVNDVVVSTAGFPSGESCTTKGNPEGLNIGAHIKNGRNKFSLELVGSMDILTSGIDAISASLVAQFTGEEPKIKPPPPEWWPYAKWGLIGVSALVVGLVIIPKVVELVRKPKA